MLNIFNGLFVTEGTAVISDLYRFLFLPVSLGIGIILALS